MSAGRAGEDQAQGQAEGHDGQGEKSALAGRRPGSRTCPRCGTVFVCGMAAGAPRCWCDELPPIMPLPQAQPGPGCYCPDCLRQMIAAAQATAVAEAARATATTEADQGGRKS